MKYRVAVAGICIALVMSLAGCSTDKQAAKQQNPADQAAAEVESQYGDPVSFEDYNILTLEGELVDVSYSMPMYRYEVQNKSDVATVSNIVLEYHPYTETGEPIENEFDDDTEELPVVLEPRERAFAMFSTRVDEDKAAETVNLVTLYTYDMNGKRYTVDILNEAAFESEIDDPSNVAFDDKNILAFKKYPLVSYRSKSCTNNGKLKIETLDVTVAIYNGEGAVRDVETVAVLESGDGGLKPGKSCKVEVSEISSGGKNGHIEPVAYTYTCSKADEDGYNRFEVNLVTGQAIGSTDELYLENRKAEKVNAKKEIAQYVKVFGKKIDTTDFEVSRIEANGDASEYLYLDPNATFLGLEGELMLIRDYDTLKIVGLRFDSADESDSANNHMLKALEKSYGTNYESVYDGDKLDSAKWTFENYRIYYDLGYSLITVRQND